MNEKRMMMKKILITLLLLTFTACASHKEPSQEPTRQDKKGGFVVESHEPPIGVLDGSVNTLDNLALFSKTIYFEPGSARITPESRKVLNGLMGMMQLEPNYTVHIIGLADETEAKPITLSMRRALSVAQLLRSAGINPNRIRVNGQGRDRNLGCLTLPNGQSNRKAIPQNKKAQIKVIPNAGIQKPRIQSMMAKKKTPREECLSAERIVILTNKF